MTRRKIRLLLIGLVITVLTIYIGCSQPADVLVRVANTDVYLNEMWNYPSSYDGMMYELWVADDNDTISLGKFGYSNKLRLFYDEFGNDRTDSNMFHLDDDLIRFDKIFISVEPDPDPHPSRPSAIMLIDDATDPNDDALDLIFPEITDTMPLWSATCRFYMETVSDDSTYLKPGHLNVIMNTRDTATNGFGLWFGNYRRSLDSLRDTISGKVDSITIKIDTFDKPDTFVSARLIENIEVLQQRRVFGLDTLDQTVIRFDSIKFTDSTPPETAYIPWWTYETMPPLDEPARELHSDTFSQDDYRLPNFEQYGWKYKGWVVSPLIDRSSGVLNPPAWSRPYNDTFHNDIRIPGDYGGLLTTGTFSEIGQPDDANLYTLSDRVPPLPGEEFWQNLPNNHPPVNLIPHQRGNTGTVFITLEPIDLQGPNAVTNFPLFVMIRNIPSDRDTFTQDSSSTGTPIFTSMHNWTQHTDPGRGFPRVKASISRY